jgi:hypothetical protein
VCKDGGKHPFWNDTLYFTNPQSQLIIQVWDNNMIIDDIVAEGTYNIQQLYNYPGYRSDNCTCLGYSEFVDVFYKGKPAGRVLLSMQLQGGGLQQGGFNQGGFGGGNFNNNGW